MKAAIISSLLALSLLACAGSPADDADSSEAAVETPRDAKVIDPKLVTKIEAELRTVKPATFKKLSIIPSEVADEMSKSVARTGDKQATVYSVTLPTAGSYYAIDARNEEGQELTLVEVLTFVKVICKSPMKDGHIANTVKCIGD